jgi:hypothetical protein
MTDLAQVAAVTIDRSASLKEANDYMIARGVRSLFVASPEGNVHGLITTSDTLSERPVSVSHARGIKRHELLVSDVMTPIDAVVAMTRGRQSRQGRSHRGVTHRLGGITVSWRISGSRPRFTFAGCFPQRRSRGSWECRYKSRSSRRRLPRSSRSCTSRTSGF